MAELPQNEAGHTEAVRKRIRYLLDHRWGGSQRGMARAIGVSQGLISKVLSATQKPGRRLLGAIERYPGINSDWLRNGIGHPLPTPEQGSLPVALGVLPGPPLEYPHLLTGSRHPVADAMYRLSRYWMSVPSQSPLLSAERFQVRPGDLLLLEAERVWAGRPDLAAGRLCGVRTGSGPAAEYRLARVGQRFDRLVMDLGNLPAASAPAATSPPQVNSAPWQAPPAGPRRRFIRHLYEKAQKRSEPETRPPAQVTQVDTESPCNVDDIVAVCVYMVRPDPMFL